MVRNRQPPSGTLRTETECSDRRKLAVQLHLGEGLTIRETGERLGVSHCTVIRDLRATVAENDAESKMMAAFYRDRLVQKLPAPDAQG